MNDLAYRVSVGCGVPLILAGIGILGKKISRGRNGGWSRADFYLGVEFALAGVAAGLANFIEAFHRTPNPPEGILVGNFLVAFLGLVGFIFVLTLHLDYEDEAHQGNARRIELKMLAGVANAIGFAVLLAGLAFMPV